MVVFTFFICVVMLLYRPYFCIHVVFVFMLSRFTTVFVFNILKPHSLSYQLYRRAHIYTNVKKHETNTHTHTDTHVFLVVYFGFIFVFVLFSCCLYFDFAFVAINRMSFNMQRHDIYCKLCAPTHTYTSEHSIVPELMTCTVLVSLYSNKVYFVCCCFLLLYKLNQLNRHKCTKGVQRNLMV